MRSLPTPLFARLVLSNVFLVAALDAGKEWLLAPDVHVGVFWVLIRVLACAGLGVLVWEGFTGELGKRVGARIEQASILTALFRMSAIRVILFTHFSSFCVDALIHRSSLHKAAALAVAFFFSFLSDADFMLSNIKSVFPGYAVLVLFGLASSGLEHTQSVLAPALGTNTANMACTLGATVVALPFYIFKQMIYESPETPAVPLFSLLALPALAYSLLFLTPNTHSSVRAVALPAQHFSLSYASTLIPALVLGPLAFSQIPSWTDCVVGGLLFYGAAPDSTQTLGQPSRTPTSRLAKAYLKTILANPESRKIFYFLVLNLAYMLVQMLYGVWTNSLGLISDAIHMAFDCMAIGMGLFASVMATWPPNERFTYGYGRIETLSGFANGIFLILISIFIVFEAIQRILDPPEMNTNQLLLVSTLGLGVNLFGMFAMGGHHHALSVHSHSHAHSPELHFDDGVHAHERGHSNDHGDNHNHGHGNGHSHNHSPLNHSPLSIHSPESRSKEHHYSHDHDRFGHEHEHCSACAYKPVPAHKWPDMVPTPGFLSPGSPDSIPSPLTPSYEFGHDAHFALHHEHGHAARVPNLHDHSHSHGGEHEGHSHNMRGVFLHVMADTLGSVGVIISTLLIQFYGWTGFDPIASLFIAILIAASVIPLVIDSGKVLCLDVGEREDSIKQALAELPTIEGLASYSSPRFWPKDSSSLIGSIRIQLEPSRSSFDPTGPHSSTKTVAVDTILRKISGLEELTIQVEGSPSA
ncbi:cation efflux protein [Phellopilus nigrolimitatus]|nr:cation efflux protein [Phellopilus nigrolimitatus]